MNEETKELLYRILIILCMLLFLLFLILLIWWLAVYVGNPNDIDPIIYVA